MIAFLSGTIESLTADTAVIDVGGVGYEVNISAEVSSGLSTIGTGNAVKLYTYTYIREGQVALFGFMSRDDLSLFRQLITVSGIGPKGGLSLLSVLSADDLRFAVFNVCQRIGSLLLLHAACDQRHGDAVRRQKGVEIFRVLLRQNFRFGRMSPLC